MAIPDGPLIFWTTCFLYAIKLYLKKDNVKNVILLSICVSCMLYSKYHGFLTLVLVMVSMPYLFRRGSFYLIILVSLILFLPHILWQIDHDLISVKYHLFERSSNKFNINNVTDFFASFSPIVAGLMLVPLVFYKKVKYQFVSDDDIERKFNRMLIWTILGFLPFFLIFATRGPVEVNWVFSASVSFIIWFGNKIDLQHKLVKITGLISLISFSILRLMLMTQTIPDVGLLHHYAGYEQWALETKKIVGNKKVVFLSNYQLASLYGYYNNEVPFSQNVLNSRVNHYNITNNDKYFNGQEVVVLGLWNHFFTPEDTIHVGSTIMERKLVENYYALNWLLLKEGSIQMEGEQLKISMLIDNKGNYPLLELWNENKLHFHIGFQNGQDHIIKLENDLIQFNGDSILLNFNMSILEDCSEFRVGVSYEGNEPSINSSVITME